MKTGDPTARTASVPDRDGQHCFHCGDAVAPDAPHRILIEGRSRSMCCAGCAAVAETIIAAGLGDYYRLRGAFPSGGADRVPKQLERARVLANPAVERTYARDLGDSRREANLVLSGAECAACAWLVERQLESAPGVIEVAVNFSTHRVYLRWDGERTGLAPLVERVARLGYGLAPYDPGRREQDLDRERSDRLRRLAVAGLFGMQIMMVAVALYGGDWWGMASEHAQLFRWFSLALALPVVGYSALPFFQAAVRGVVNRAPGMDLPVALAIAIAFAASALSTLRGSGHVYFDSVAMFTFALLFARYFELLARRRAQQRTETLLAPTPELAHRVLDDGGDETVLACALAAGDRVRVRPGESVPADGVLVAGRASLDESLLSGESRPVSRTRGEALLAGSINVADPLEMQVTRVGADTVVSGILALVERAAAERPALVALADRVASVFVVVVVAAAVAVAIGWSLIDAGAWLAPTIAVLVVSCPCALSLATPTALTAAATLIADQGLVPARGLALESLARVNHVVFDKTGTLTTGRLSVHEVRPLGPWSHDQCLRIAVAIERQSAHPIATAVRELWPGPTPLAGNVRVSPGQGLAADVDGERWWLGTPRWVGERSGAAVGDVVTQLEHDGSSVVMLASRRGAACVLCLGDEIRSDAQQLLRALAARGIRVTLLSGDRSLAVERVASELAIDDWEAELLPAQKLARLKVLERGARVVAAVGDGINDAPVLAGATVSIAMGEGSQAARANADFIALGNRLMALHDALEVARATRATIAWNLAWAAGYNLLALPAAAAGLIAPWMAAVGMSASSLLVLGNSLRLYGRGAGRFQS